MTALASYRQFIASKGSSAVSAGFEPVGLPARLFPHQRRAVEFACNRGRAALFLDTGLGKSGCEAVFADQCARQTGKPSLILTPLAVARQMQRECAAFDVEATVIRDAADVRTGVNIANYERLPRLDASRFGCVVLDESSILKSFNGATKRALIEAFAATPYRLAATATPAPNDHMELGNHSEFLGYLGSMEMLCRWFINDTSTASQHWRLKGHATADFWQWVSSWARAASMPSDLGGEDDGFILPPLHYEVHWIATGAADAPEGMLFRLPSSSATSIHRDKRLTEADRVAKAAEIANATDEPVVVWCETNSESAALARAIRGAAQIGGSDKPEVKESRLEAFLAGRSRVLVTKPKVAGFGLNMQHCNTTVFASLSHSYEQHYQAVRRFHRFGQTRPVTVHVVLPDTEQTMWANVRRKADDHTRLKAFMAEAMRGVEQGAERRAYERTSDVTLPAFMQSEDSHAA
ncbi:MAG: helicase-related protein [Pseudomonadota bacterium]